MDAPILRRMFLEFFQEHGHAVIAPGALVPAADPSVLFTTAGMHPLVPYLLGAPHPAGRRLASCQPCLRTDDIAEVGDAVHLTFFEMLGSWSLGAYWQTESLGLSYRFLTERLGLDPARLHVTCFAGDAAAPRDTEAAALWQALGIPAARLSFLPRADNWWGPVGETGPCGPDSEIFYDMQPDGPPGATPATDQARFWEVWNNVFMAYTLRPDGSYAPLGQRNVDTGLGLERVLAILEGVPSPYETTLFRPIVAAARALAADPEPFAVRVIADHIRAATFALAEGVRPGKVERAYVVRRLIRRAIRYGRAIGIRGPFLARLAESTIPTLADAYPLLAAQQAAVCAALDAEEARFGRTLAGGERELARATATLQRQGTTVLPGAEVFRLYSTFGFPPELTAELAAAAGLEADLAGFAAAFAAHQILSREAGATRFAGRSALNNSQ